MNILKIVLLTLVVTPALTQAAPDSEKFREMYEREWAFRLAEFPGLATYAGSDAYNDRLGHVSQAHQQRRKEYWQGVREELESISCQRLEPAECIDYRIYRKQIDDFITGIETQAFLLTFNSDWGFYMGWARMPDTTEFVDAKDYRDYLARLAMIPEIMDEYIGLMRLGIEIGFTQPREVLDGREAPIAAQLVDDPTQSAFYAPLEERPAGVPEADWPALRERAQEVIETNVVPAYRKLYAFITDEYMPAARETLGAYELPGGKEFYKGQIRYYATVDMSPAQIHELGLSEVDRIKTEMLAIIEAVQFDGDLAAFIAFLRTDPQFYAETPRELLAEASYWAKKIDGRLPQLFGLLPRQPYGVAPVPEDIAPFYTAGRYMGAPLDARRGGYYWVNTHGLESRPLYALPALTLHEGAPGHHLQNALAKENADQPPFRRYDYISAYGEGWGLYAEKLGVEMDIYETPYDHFGRLTYEMWRACRLVIDTGVHAFGWSRQQALDYLAGHTALSLHEVTTEVDRYISWPAQALSYKLGEYTIWELRREAEAELGTDFDIRAFHDHLLSLGSVPLEVLSEELRGWIVAQAPEGGQN